MKADSYRDTLGAKIMAGIWGRLHLHQDIFEDSCEYDGICFDQPPVEAPYASSGDQLSESRSLDYWGLGGDSTRARAWYESLRYSFPFIWDTINVWADTPFIAATVSEMTGGNSFSCGGETYHGYGLRGRDYHNCILPPADSTNRQLYVSQLFSETWLKPFSTPHVYNSGGSSLSPLIYLWQYICHNQRALVMFEFTASKSTTVGPKLGYSAGDTLIADRRIFYWGGTAEIGDTILFGAQNTSNASDTIGRIDGSGRAVLKNAADCYCNETAREVMIHASLAAYYMVRPGNAFDSSYDDRLHYGNYVGVQGNGGRPACNSSGSDSRAHAWTDLALVDFGEPLNGMDFGESTFAALISHTPWTSFDTGLHASNPVYGDVYSRKFVKGSDTNMILWRVYEAADAYLYDSSTYIDTFSLGGWYRRVKANQFSGGCDTLPPDTLVYLFRNDGAFLLAGSGSCGIGYSPTSLNFTDTVGTSNPTAKIVVLSQSGDTSASIKWTATKGETWLSISPASGEVSIALGPDTITASPSLSGLTAGTYYDTIVVTDTTGCADNSPVSIPVTFVVVAAPAPETGGTKHHGKFKGVKIGALDDGERRHQIHAGGHLGPAVCVAAHRGGRELDHGVLK
jgi:hypothetical protein